MIKDRTHSFFHGIQIFVVILNIETKDKTTLKAYESCREGIWQGTFCIPYHSKPLIRCIILYQRSLATLTKTISFMCHKTVGSTLKINGLKNYWSIKAFFYLEWDSKFILKFYSNMEHQYYLLVEIISIIILNLLHD